MGSFWSSRASFGMKRGTFISKVQNAGLAGMESYALLESEERQLDSKISIYLRSLCAGSSSRNKACIKPIGGIGYHKKLNNYVIFKRWRILPTQAELAVRTMSWLQNITKDKQTNSQLIASVWGKLPDDGESTLLPNGSLSSTANPFAKLFEKRLLLYENISGTETFFELWRAATCRGPRSSMTRTFERSFKTLTRAS